MMGRLSRYPVARWLNPLLGVALILVAGLDITLLAGIGWSAWQRASLSEQWLRMREEDRLQPWGSHLEARELRELIATSQRNIASSLGAFPTEADLARHVAELRTQAANLGLEPIEVSQQPAEPGLAPARRLGVQARGSWPQLVALLTFAAQTALPTARIEEVALAGQAKQAELCFELIVVIRPADPLATNRDPRDSIAATLPGGMRHEE